MQFFIIFFGIALSFVLKNVKIGIKRKTKKKKKEAKNKIKKKRKKNIIIITKGIITLLPVIVLITAEI